MQPRMYLYYIDEGETFHISAPTMLDALTIHAENFGYESAMDWIKDMHIFEIRQLPDDEMLSIGDHDNPEAPRVEKTCREWAEEYPNKLVASTIY